jgi:cardiolipin synthase
MDPAADKLLLAAAAVTLTVEGHFPISLLILLIVRDLVIVAGAGIYYLLTGPFQVIPSKWGKLSTFMQISLLLAVMTSLALPAFSLQEYAQPMAGLLQIGYSLVAVVGLLSGFTYLWLWTTKLSQNSDRKKQADVS